MNDENTKFKKDFDERLLRFSLDIIRLCEVENIKSDSKRIIENQIIRSATSIGANVMEAKSSSSRKDYTHFFEISLKSANETKYWLTLAKNLWDGKERICTLLEECDQISRIIASSVLTLKNKKCL